MVEMLHVDRTQGETDRFKCIYFKIEKSLFILEKEAK